MKQNSNSSKTNTKQPLITRRDTVATFLGGLLGKCIEVCGTKVAEFASSGEAEREQGKTNTRMVAGMIQVGKDQHLVVEAIVTVEQKTAKLVATRVTGFREGAVNLGELLLVKIAALPLSREVELTLDFTNCKFGKWNQYARRI